MKRCILSFFFFLLGSGLVAEGTHELAPNRAITINGNITTDIAALLIGHGEFSDFAYVKNSDPYGQLYINIQDPAMECIYLGFSVGHYNRTSLTPPLANFSFIIKDPNGNIVYGPQAITESNANISSWASAYNGPDLGGNPEGYIPIIVSSGDLMSQGWSGPGDYYIQFDYEMPRHSAEWEGLLIDFWDISVVNCLNFNPHEIKGRLWSYNWALFAINDYGFPNRPFNGKFYVCAVDPGEEDLAFISSIDFNGGEFRPGAFNIAFNNFGTRNTGNVQRGRRSVENANLTVPKYPIFLNDPVEIYGTPEEGDVEFIELKRGADGMMCFMVRASKTGVVELLLDFDKGDGEYTESTSDVLLSHYIEDEDVGQTVCIPWNGVDGDGVPIVDGTFPLVIMYNRGVFHFPIYDAEIFEHGFTLSRVRPSGEPPLLFYDDSEISGPSGSGEDDVNLKGCTTPCHTWVHYIDPDVVGFGNLNTINSWWYSNRIFLRATAAINLNYYIPNAFTPNGDGLNDRAKVFLDERIIGVKRFEVFDRWGNRVYDEAYANGVRDMKGWNGVYKDYPMFPAVFAYKATIEVHPGVYMIDHGTLSLIR